MINFVNIEKTFLDVQAKLEQAYLNIINKEKDDAKRREQLSIVDAELYELLVVVPREFLTFQDERGFNIGMYATTYLLPKSANYVYANKTARTQRTTDGLDMKALGKFYHVSLSTTRKPRLK